MNTNLLSEKAMLVNLQISMWGGKTRDRSVTNEVLLQKEAESDSGEWITNLVPKDLIKKIDNASSRIRTTHAKWTLPWLDGGIRILPAATFLKYGEEMRKAEAIFQAEVEEFLAKYPSICAAAQKRLGKLIQNKYMPTVDEIRGRFSVRFDILPAPSVSDFRVQMGDAQAEEVKQKIQQSIQSTAKVAMEELWRRLGTLVNKVQEKLADPDKKFKDSLIENLTEFCNELPNMNLTDDTELEAIRQEVLYNLSSLDPDDLRENKQNRKDAADAAQEILDKMKTFYGA